MSTSSSYNAMLNSWLATLPAVKTNRRNSNASTASVTAVSNTSTSSMKPNKPKNVAAITANWNATSKARNNAYTRKIAQWKASVASGKVNVSPAPSRKRAPLSRNANFLAQLASLPKPAERTYGESYKPEWMVQKAKNNSGNRAKAIQARMAAMVRPAGNVRHTAWKGKTRRTRRN